MDEDLPEPPQPHPIHITALEIPVSYQAVLNVVPDLHARPPVLPYPNDPAFAIPPPPINGYDFMFHIGVAGRGPLRMEKLGHKNGYRMKDVDGLYAPIVHLPKDRDSVEAAEVERMELFLGLVSSNSGPGQSGSEGGNDNVDIPPNRGFGKGYENFPEEIHTEIDVAKVCNYLKENGIEVQTSHGYSLSYRTHSSCLCSKCIRPWMLAITSVTLCFTARLPRRNA